MRLRQMQVQQVSARKILRALAAQETMQRIVMALVFVHCVERLLAIRDVAMDHVPVEIESNSRLFQRKGAKGHYLRPMAGVFVIETVYTETQKWLEHLFVIGREQKVLSCPKTGLRLR